MRMQIEKMTSVTVVYIASAIFIVSSYLKVLKKQAVLFHGPIHSHDALSPLHVHSCNAPDRPVPVRTERVSCNALL